MIETTMLSPLEVNLDFANPRFSMFDFTTEKEIIRYLIDFEQIKELAFQIGENGYNTIGERVIVLKSNEGNYTVLEGNRRIASLKLLFQYHSLLKSSERKKIEQLKLNIEDFGVNCDIVTEDNRDEALFKISAKHVDGIKTWSANDKRVFYFNLYSQYRKKGLTSDQALSKIKVITPEGKVAIRNAIRQLNYLTAVYNATIIFQSDLEKLTHLDTDVLVSRVLSPLSKDLNLEFDDNFQIVAQNDKVYHEILGLIGKAVWIDKTLDTRVFSVQGQWNEIVKNDKVIPGLAGKIKEYKESEESNSFEAGLSNSPQNDDTQRNEDISEDDSKSYNSLDNNADEKTNNNIDMQSKVTKYKFFVPKHSVTIKQQNYDLTNSIELVDSFGKKVSRQSSEYSGISISCTHQNIVIQNNVIDSISENGQYTIDVEYAGKTKHFQIFLNISINTQPPEHQVLFSRQWYDESLSILSANPKYFKICGVIRNIQKYNSLSNNNDDYIILAFLLRALLEYSAKAYIDKFSIKKSGDSLSTLISTVKAHLSDKGFLNREEVKALKNTNDIETLNGLIHDFGTNISSIDVKTICSKYQKYLSVAFERLSEGENNG